MSDLNRANVDLRSIEMSLLSSDRVEKLEELLVLLELSYWNSFLIQKVCVIVILIIPSRNCGINVLEHWSSGGVLSLWGLLQNVFIKDLQSFVNKS